MKNVDSVRSTFRRGAGWARSTADDVAPIWQEEAVTDRSAPALRSWLSACGGGASTTTTTQRPLPAGTNPSTISKMVCTNDAVQKFDSALGNKARVSNRDVGRPPLFVHLHLPERIDGAFREGAFQLASDDCLLQPAWPLVWAGPAISKNSAKARSRQRTDLSSCGRTGRCFLVDASGLPPQFGNPSTSSADAAVTVGDVVLGLLVRRLAKFRPRSSRSRSVRVRRATQCLGCGIVGRPESSRPPRPTCRSHLQYETGPPTPTRAGSHSGTIRDRAPRPGALAPRSPDPIAVAGWTTCAGPWRLVNAMDGCRFPSTVGHMSERNRDGSQG